MKSIMQQFKNECRKYHMAPGIWQALTWASFWPRNSADHRRRNKHHTGLLSHSGSQWNPWGCSCRGQRSAWPHLSGAAVCTRWAHLWKGSSVRQREEKHKLALMGTDAFHWRGCSRQTGPNDVAQLTNGLEQLLLRMKGKWHWIKVSHWCCANPCENQFLWKLIAFGFEVKFDDAAVSDQYLAWFVFFSSKK